MTQETTYNNYKKNTENTKNSVKDFADDVAEAGNKAFSGNSVKEIASKIVDEITEFLAERKSEISGVKGKCKEHIKENPFIVVLGSLLGGILLGLLFRK